MNNIIEVKNLRKTYLLTRKQQKQMNHKEKQKIAIDDISFCVKKGEAFGLLGPNGAGKTTTLRILATLIDPDRGEVYIRNKDIKNNKEFAQNNIGFLTSELKLEGYFTPDFMFDYFAGLYGIDKKTSAERKKVLFEKFAIDSYSNVKISKLSTGMKQKVSIVISLIHDPDILIYDEPTNGLDIITAKMVIDYLCEQKKNGKTIVISTHIFDVIEKLCDRVCIIMNGKVVYSSTLEQVFSNGTLENLFFKKYDEMRNDNEK